MPEVLADDQAVLNEVARAIRWMHARKHPYADLFSPMHDEGLRELAAKLTIRVRGESLGTQDVEAVSPPVFGRYILLYSTDIDDYRRRFALRHGIGHVVAGHVSETSYLRNRDDFMRHEERVADVFALCDLMPFYHIDDMRKARMSWRSIAHAVWRLIRQHTLDWPESRVEDRAQLRVALYRRTGY